MKQEVTTSVITVTPKAAKRWMERNHLKQRNVSPSHVTHLAQQMKAGQWVMNGEPIIFGSEDELIDGQHRLMAIIESGVSCQMMVVQGVSSAVFATINTGKTRSNGNVLAMHGVPNYSAVASIVAGVWNYKRALESNKGRGGSLNSYIRASKTDLVSEYDKHAHLYQHACHLGMKSKHMGAVTPIGIVMAMALIDGDQDREVIDAFGDSLASGIGLENDSPVYWLRERLNDNRAAKTKLSRHRVTLIVAKAWNLYADEKPCKLLRVQSDMAFPIN